MVLSVVVSFGKTNGLCIGTQVLPNGYSHLTVSFVSAGYIQVL